MKKWEVSIMFYMPKTYALIQISASEISGPFATYIAYARDFAGDFVTWTLTCGKSVEWYTSIDVCMYHGIEHDRVTSIFLVYTQAFRRVSIPRKHIQVISYVEYSMIWQRSVCCITMLYHTIENTVAITIHVAHNGKFAMGVISSSIQWLSCILIGCIFFRMV